MSSEKKPYTWDEILEMYPPSEDGKVRAAREREAYLASYNLKQIRKLRSFTQVALAGILKISQNRISQIERGHLENSEVGTLGRYVEALGGELTVSAKFGEQTYVLATKGETSR
jgi:DNA-binding XRE family transcriptional regulator